MHKCLFEQDQKYLESSDAAIYQEEEMEYVELEDRQQKLNQQQRYLDESIQIDSTRYFEPSNNDNLTMRDLSINSSDNTRSIGSSVASGLVMTY